MLIQQSALYLTSHFLYVVSDWRLVVSQIQHWNSSQVEFELFSWAPRGKRWFPLVEGEWCVAAAVAGRIQVHRLLAAEWDPTGGRNQTEEERKDRPDSPPRAHSTCTAVAAQGRSYNQSPSCGGGGPLPVMDFLLPASPPASSGSAGEHHTAAMSGVAGRGGALAPDCC